MSESILYNIWVLNEHGSIKITIIHIFLWFFMERTVYKAVENICSWQRQIIL